MKKIYICILFIGLLFCVGCIGDGARITRLENELNKQQAKIEAQNEAQNEEIETLKIQLDEATSGIKALIEKMGILESKVDNIKFDRILPDGRIIIKIGDKEYAILIELIYPEDIIDDARTTA